MAVLRWLGAIVLLLVVIALLELMLNSFDIVADFWVLLPLVTIASSLHGLWQQGKQYRDLHRANPLPSHDVTAENRPLPESHLGLFTPLPLLGFERLGESAVSMSNQMEGVEWVFRNQSGTTLAIVVVIENVEIINFVSWFGETTLLMTAYPLGERIETPDLLCLLNEESVESAYRQHLNAFPHVKGIGGEPHLFTSMAEYEAFDLMFHEHHKPRHRQRLRTINYIALVRSLWWLIWGINWLLFTVWDSDNWVYGCIFWCGFPIGVLLWWLPTPIFYYQRNYRIDPQRKLS